MAFAFGSGSSNSHIRLTLILCLKRINVYDGAASGPPISTLHVFVVSKRNLDFHLHTWLPRMKSAFPGLLDMAI